MLTNPCSAPMKHPFFCSSSNLTDLFFSLQHKYIYLTMVSSLLLVRNNCRSLYNYSRLLLSPIVPNGGTGTRATTVATSARVLATTGLISPPQSKGCFVHSIPLLSGPPCFSLIVPFLASLFFFFFSFL